MLSYFKEYWRCRKLSRLRERFQPGKTIARFIARDVRREVLVVSADEIEDGFITVRIRTTNVLYVSNGLVKDEEFGPSERVAIEKLWGWSGQSWVGLPDGTSIAESVEDRLN